MTKRFVKLKKGDDSYPLFCFPGAASTPVSLYALATVVPTKRSIYAYSYKGVSDSNLAQDTVGELSEEIISEIFEIQPSGPYLLSGYCLGGIIAFDIADKLRQTGELVTKLVLLDTMPPIRLKNIVSSADSLGVNSEVALAHKSKLIKANSEMVRILKLKLNGLPAEEGLRIRKATDAHNLAWIRYSANKIDVDIAIFRTESYSLEILGIWAKFTSGEFSSVNTSGRTDSLLTIPHVVDLGKELAQVVDV